MTKKMNFRIVILLAFFIGALAFCCTPKVEIPSYLKGKYYADFRDIGRYFESYMKLLETMGANAPEITGDYANLHVVFC